MPGRRPQFIVVYELPRRSELSLTDIAVDNMVALFEPVDVEPRFLGDSGSFPTLIRPLVHKRLKLNDGIVMPAQGEELNLLLRGGLHEPHMDVLDKLVAAIFGLDPSW